MKALKHEPKYETPTLDIISSVLQIISQILLLNFFKILF